ncbi:hypothetical protein [Streptomyces sp. NBC_00286]|nr:hypothetical protein [Streptomyces sp. NBC_00286]
MTRIGKAEDKITETCGQRDGQPSTSHKSQPACVPSATPYVRAAVAYV